MAEKWVACQDGKCLCKTILGEEAPIAEIISGDWGDDYPTIEVSGPSMDRTVKAVMKQTTYGHVPEEVAEAHITEIVALHNAAIEIGDPMGVAENIGAVIKLAQRIAEALQHSYAVAPESYLHSELRIALSKLGEK